METYQITLIVIGIYILNIFIARGLNWICYRYYNDEIMTYTWFIPIFGPVVWLTITIRFICINIDNNNWFGGNNWTKYNNN